MFPYKMQNHIIRSYFPTSTKDRYKGAFDPFGVFSIKMKSFWYILKVDCGRNNSYKYNKRDINKWKKDYSPHNKNPA